MMRQKKPLTISDEERRKIAESYWGGQNHEGYGYNNRYNLGEDDEPEDDAQGAAPADGGSMPADGGGMPADGGAAGGPSDDMGDMGGQGMPQGQPDGGMPDMGQPMGMDAGMEPPMDDEPVDDEDTVDIGDLTKAQAKAYKRTNDVGQDLGKVDDRIGKLSNQLNTMLNVIDKNNKEIDSLKKEFKRRNPTSVEKMNLRSLSSYPFNANPAEYWAKKARGGVYDPYPEDEGKGEKEYVITAADVDNPSADINNTFGIDDDDIQDMQKIFGY